MKLVTHRPKADGPRLGVVAVATVAVSVAVVACAGPFRTIHVAGSVYMLPRAANPTRARKGGEQMS